MVGSEGRRRILEAFPWLLDVNDMQHFVQERNVSEFQRIYGQDADGKTLGSLEARSILSFKQRLCNQLEPLQRPTYSQREQVQWFDQIGKR